MANEAWANAGKLKFSLGAFPFASHLYSTSKLSSQVDAIPHAPLDCTDTVDSLLGPACKVISKDPQSLQMSHRRALAVQEEHATNRVPPSTGLVGVLPYFACLHTKQRKRKV
ncbi:hypothetical protein UY3_04264 [Chelonia mydas]|uniref:Uncharacterized protein n=1 Tax=Chelonia mydas TaxID=8469 RepID=M7C2B4_CHEMY|nr:hypothetical protein UY3_04264 [Chelonia mydas]